MPITEYKVVVGTSVEELTDGVSGEGLVPVGDLDPSTADYALQAAGMGTVDAGAVSDFEVMLGETPELLEERVNARIAQGFQPVGGVYSWQRGFIQAVGKVTGGGGGGGGGTVPTGAKYQVASFNPDTGSMQAADMNMNIWTGADLPRYDAAMRFVPVTNFAAGGMSSTQSCQAVDAMPTRFSIAMRDENGRLGVETAYLDYQAVNLKQLKDIAALPAGTERQIVTFDAAGKATAALFNANHWSEFPGGAPTTGVWLAAYIPDSTEVMGFASAAATAEENTVALRTSNGPSGNGGGRLKASPAIEADDVLVYGQINDLRYTLPAAAKGALGGVKAVEAPIIDVSDPPDSTLLQKNFADLISALKAAGVLV